MNKSDMNDCGNDEMEIAEFDTSATIANAKEPIRYILQSMEKSLQIAKKAEVSSMIKEFKQINPNVQSQGFYDKGPHSELFHLVRDARCFFMVMQWNKGENGNYNREVLKLLHSCFVS